MVILSTLSKVVGPRPIGRTLWLIIGGYQPLGAPTLLQDGFPMVLKVPMFAGDFSGLCGKNEAIMRITTFDVFWLQRFTKRKCVYMNSINSFIYIFLCTKTMHTDLLYICICILFIIVLHLLGRYTCDLGLKFSSDDLAFIVQSFEGVSNHWGFTNWVNLSITWV